MGVVINAPWALAGHSLDFACAYVLPLPWLTGRLRAGIVSRPGVTARIHVIRQA